MRGGEISERAGVEFMFGERRLCDCNQPITPAISQRFP